MEAPRGRVLVLASSGLTRSTTLVDWGFEHSFLVDGVPCIVRVIPRGIIFSHEFLPATEPLPDAMDHESLQDHRRATLKKWQLAILITAFGVLFVAFALFAPLPIGESILFSMVGLMNFGVAIWYGIKGSRTSTDLIDRHTDDNE